MQPPQAHPFDRLRARSMAGVGLVVSIVVAVVAGVAFSIAEIPPDRFDTAWMYTVLFALLCPALLWWGTRRGLDVRRLFGPLPRDPAAWGAAFAPLLAVLGAASLLMVGVGIWSYVAPETALERVNGPAFGSRNPFGEEAGTVATIVAAVLVAPVAEELVFRGLLMQRWIRKWGVWGGVLGSSAVFGALHLTYAPLAFLTGVVLALLYLATGSLWVPIAAHALNNVFVSVLKLVPERPEETIALAELRGGMVPSLLFAAACGFMLYRLRGQLWPSPGMPVPYALSDEGVAGAAAPPFPEATFLIVLRPARVEMLTGGPTAEEAELVERHFEHLRALARSGVVRMAGRTTDAGSDTLGIVLVAAPSEEGARAIMLDDPAVRGGVMTAELHPFRVAVASETRYLRA